MIDSYTCGLDRGCALFRKRKIADALCGPGLSSETAAATPSNEKVEVQGRMAGSGSGYGAGGRGLVSEPSTGGVYYLTYVMSLWGTVLF